MDNEEDIPKKDEYRKRKRKPLPVLSEEEKAHNRIRNEEKYATESLDKDNDGYLDDTDIIDMIINGNGDALGYGD